MRKLISRIMPPPMWLWLATTCTSLSSERNLGFLLLLFPELLTALLCTVLFVLNSPETGVIVFWIKRTMGALHRALFTWFVLLVFLILLVLRLDSRIQWNWFIVFIPIWFYDTILMIYVFFNMMSSCRKGLDRLSTSVQRKLMYLLAIVLKLTSLIILCLKLENIVPNISTVYIMIPIWIILPFTISDVFMMLIRSSRNRYI